MSGIVRLFTNQRLHSILGKTYIGIGTGIGMWDAKQTLDYYITDSHESPINKTVDRIEAVLCGSVNGSMWPMTLYDEYRRMQKSKNVKNP